MKQIYSINELLNAINNKVQVYHEVNGKIYSLSLQAILQTPLGNLLFEINNGLLFCHDI